MKMSRVSFLILVVLPLVISLAVLCFLPDAVPVHFDAAGNATRWAGRAAVLVIPSLSAAGGLIMGTLARRGKTPQSRKIWLWGAVVVMLVFLCVTVWYLWKIVTI